MKWFNTGMLGILISCLILVSYATDILDEGDIVQDDEGLPLTDWTNIERNVKVEYDLSIYPLQIETKSAKGSNEKINVRFWEDSNIIGDVTITFGDDITYSLSHCSDDIKGNTVPEETVKVWTLRKTSAKFTIECNDVLVLEVMFAEMDCLALWDVDVNTIEFLSDDQASLKFRAIDTDEFESLCANSSCYPRWGNLLKGRKVFANSTCGQEGNEEYCLVSNNREEIMCGICNAQNMYKQHPPNYMKDRRIKSRTTWWKAVNGEDKVTLQLDLETTFQFTHLIMVFYSFRPGAMVIERSTDYGKSWNPYQYFAYDCQKVFGMRERELGEPDEYGVQHHPDEDVICTSKYSYLEPAQGGEVIYKVIRGRPTINTNRASLRNLLLLTNLRVRFVKLHTLGDDLWDPNDAEAKKKYFYAVEDWVVRGSCFCNGHSDKCTPMAGMEGSDLIKNMINGQCECEHNTAGNNCERCKDFHHSTPWKPGDPGTGEAHPCKECSCNGHSDVCEFDESLYLATGDGGRCLECRHSTAGARCDSCVYGYHQVQGEELTNQDICQPCNCNEAGTTSQVCASVSEGDIAAGTCICKANLADSLKCDECEMDHFGLDADNPLGCTACGCDTRGTVNGSTSCDIESGQCLCKENVEGQACDRCREGYFEMRSTNAEGCERCSCDSAGAADQGSCDPLTGACYCKPGFEGYSCDQIIPGFYVPTVDHWGYDPEDTGEIEGDGYRVTAGNSSGTGYVVLPVDSTITQSTDKTGPESEEEEGAVPNTLPTGYYDLVITHEPAESDYELTLDLTHLGKFDGTKPEAYQCAIDESRAFPQQPYTTQTITVTVKAGSTVTRIPDLCMDEGSQYDVKVSLDDSGSGSLKIKDLVIQEPLDPDKAFPEDPEKAEYYKEYLDRNCDQSFDNECYRLKTLLESDLSPEELASCSPTVLCLPSLDIWEFEEDKGDIGTDEGSKLTVEEGGDVTLPPGSSMTVPLDQGTEGGLKELILAHDPVAKNKQVDVKVTVTHKGNKDGSDPKSFRCNGQLIRPYSETTFTVSIKKNKKLTTIGEVCFDPSGDYEIKIEPVYNDPEADKLVVKQVYVVPPDSGSDAFPDNQELADLWDEYIAKECPKVSGDVNHEEESCIELINQINEILEEEEKKKDCSRRSCIPYRPVWRPRDPLDNLMNGSYVNPDDGHLVLPHSDSAVELPSDGSDSVTGGLSDLVLKHKPVKEDQRVRIDVIRTDSDEPYSCGILESVPSTQTVTITLRPGTNYTTAQSFCFDPKGDYEIRITAVETTEPVTITEVGSALPSDPSAAYPDNQTAAEFYKLYQDQGCESFPSDSASEECVHLANLIDYHTNPDRMGTEDCTVKFCYPRNDVFDPSSSDPDDVELSDGASFDNKDGGIIIPAQEKAVMKLDPLLTGPNSIVIEYEGGDQLPDNLEVTIIFKGTQDGTSVGEYQCRDRSVKPGTRTYTVPLDPTKSRVIFEACLLDNGVYHVEITQKETGKSVKIKAIYVELPRDTENLFPDDPAAADLVDYLVNTCVNEVFSAQCAAATRDVADKIRENNDKYKVDCTKELCIPENNVWSKGDSNFQGNVDGVEDSGGVVLSGEKFVVFQFDASTAPKSGLNSLIFTVNPEDFDRVVDVIITPVGGSKDDVQNYVMCGEVSSAKQQIVRKVIQTNVAFVEAGPLCFDPDLKYNIQLIYKGVQPTGSDRIFPETYGINVVVKSVDVVLPLKPEDAYPDNQEAADLWRDYGEAQCPRLSAGYANPDQECLDILAELHGVVNNLEEEQCATTVCVDNSAGWKHDPTSLEEKYEGGATVDGGSSDAVIELTPGGSLSIKTGDKEDVSDAAENVPYTGVMDFLIDHKKSRYSWDVEVTITHTKTKGGHIPESFMCVNGEILPYSSQTFRARAEACTSSTLIPGVCVDKDNTYSISVKVLQRVGERVEECEGAVEYEDGLPVDKFGFKFPEDPETAFPEDEYLRDQYEKYLEYDCRNMRSKACDNLDIEIIANLIGEAVGCGCDARGSLSTICVSIGGQCPCKEGYTGRTCSYCVPGWFGIREQGECQRCNCDGYGSVSEVCDSSTGQCPCHDGVLTSDDRPGLTTCSECIDGYVGLESMGIDGCVACTCGPGAAASNCDESTGTCTCLTGVAQPMCDNCMNGFYNLIPGVGCESCECDSRGSTGLGCHQETGVCDCKDNVVGSKCDSCRPNSFSASDDNPSGCFSCYCSGITEECEVAKGWFVKDKTPDLHWKVIGGASEVRPKYVLGAVSGSEFVWATADLGDFYTSYSLNIKVILTGHDDNEVLLRLYRDDMYITSTLKKIRDNTLKVKLYEHYFTMSNGVPKDADLATFKHILADITKLEITTIYPNTNKGPKNQKIRGFSIEQAVRNRNEAKRKAVSVEQCLCPEGYGGHACGTCSRGYAKVYGEDGMSFRCSKCSDLCNGYSNQCDQETGECTNCTGNTAGGECDVCQDGFYESRAEDGTLSCITCPCSRNAASPSCSLIPGDADGSDIFPVCDECEKGYTGPNCLICAPGYWGRDGQCTACECNGNIDLADPYGCNKEDGVCQNCLYNTTGVECELCLPGFYGNALRTDLPKCRECGCHEEGSRDPVCDNFSGLCDCRPHVSGNKCERCSAGYWNMTEDGCEGCGCDSRGSLSDSCDVATGQCQCKDGIQGRLCDECLAGHYSVASDDTEIECRDCGCDSEGSETVQCDELGQCTCKEGVVGAHCEECGRGTTGVFPDCVPCGECYENWEKEVKAIEDQINELAAKAQNIHLDAAGLTEKQLQDIFTELKSTLKEAEKLAKSAPGDDSEIADLTKSLQDLGEELGRKSVQLDELDSRISDVDGDTTDTLSSLDSLKDKLDTFKEETKRLEERAMSLSAANLDEALKLVEDAAERSAGALTAAQATKDQIDSAGTKAAKTDRILQDSIFQDTSSVTRLSEIEEDISDLTSKLGTLDQSVCGADPGADTCEPCGGSKCGSCGGPGCEGAVGIISEITGFAEEARQCADQRQEDVTQATGDLREISNKADEIQAAVHGIQQTSEETKDRVEETSSDLVKTKQKIEDMLQSDRATAQDIEQIIDDINSLKLPLTEDELSTLIDELTQALNDINLVNTDVEVSAPDKERVASLLDRARVLNTDAEDTLDQIIEATSALRDFDDNYNAAHDMLEETSGVLNEGWGNINQIEDNTQRAEDARSGLSADLDALERELQLLLADISSGDSIAQRAQDEIDGAKDSIQNNEEEIARLRKNYDDLDELITEKEELVDAQLEESNRGASLSSDVEQAINQKLQDVEDLTGTFVSQQQSLVDLNSLVDELELKLDNVMNNIDSKASHHAQCTNELPSK